MALMEYGATAGLAYKHDFYKEIELDRDRERIAMQKQQVEAAKAEIFANMFRMGEANNPYDHKKLKELSEKTISEGGQYQSANPDWWSNPIKRAYMQNKGNGMLHNEYTINGKIYDKQVEMLQADIKANPGIVEQDEFIDQWNAMNNYEAFGDVDGIEKNRKPFMYVPVKPWEDLNETAMKYGNKFKGVRSVVDANGFLGNYQEEIVEEQLDTAAIEYYTANKEQLDKKYPREIYESPLHYAKELLRGYVPLKSHQGNVGVSIKEWARQQAAVSGGGGNVQSFEQLLSSPGGRTSGDNFRNMFKDDIVPAVVGNDGTTVPVENFKDMKFTGDYAWLKDKNGERRWAVAVNFNIPYDMAASKDLLAGWGPFGRGLNDAYGDDDVRANYKGMIRGIGDAEGTIKNSKEAAWMNVDGWHFVDTRDVNGLRARWADALQLGEKSKGLMYNSGGGNTLPPGLHAVQGPDGRTAYTPDGINYYEGTSPDAKVVIFRKDGKIVTYNPQTGQFE